MLRPHRAVQISPQGRQVGAPMQVRPGHRGIRHRHGRQAHVGPRCERSPGLGDGGGEVVLAGRQDEGPPPPSARRAGVAPEPSLPAAVRQHVGDARHLRRVRLVQLVQHQQHVAARLGRRLEGAYGAVPVAQRRALVGRPPDRKTHLRRQRLAALAAPEQVEAAAGLVRAAAAAARRRPRRCRTPPADCPPQAPPRRLAKQRRSPPRRTRWRRPPAGPATPRARRRRRPRPRPAEGRRPPAGSSSQPARWAKRTREPARTSASAWRRRCRAAGLAETRKPRSTSSASSAPGAAIRRRAGITQVFGTPSRSCQRKSSPQAPPAQLREWPSTSKRAASHSGGAPSPAA